MKDRNISAEERREVILRALRLGRRHSRQQTQATRWNQRVTGGWGWQGDKAGKGVRRTLWSCLGKEGDLPTEGMWEPRAFPSKESCKHCLPGALPWKVLRQ